MYDPGRGYTRVTLTFGGAGESVQGVHQRGPGRKRDKGEIGDYVTERTGPVTLRE